MFKISRILVRIGILSLTLILLTDFVVRIDAQESPPGTEEFGLSMEQLVSNAEDVEFLIEECMNEAGFEYIAVDFNTIRRGMVADKSLPGLSEQEFIREYGFGISTRYTGVAPQLSEIRTPQQIGLGERNIEIFEDLSLTDQIAYNQTLLGENPDATLAVALEIEDFSRTGGCTREAIEQVFSEEEMSSTYMNPLDAMIDEDPRMVAAIADFVECIREEGFEYNHPIEIERDFRVRLDEITQDIPLEFLSEDALQELEALQEEEIAVGIVSFECEQRILEPIEDAVERDILRG